VTTVDVTAGVRPIEGPSALGGGFKRFVLLTRTLAIQDFKLRFFGSALGYFWQLMRPLLLFGVLYIVFTQVIKVGGPVKDYAVVLLGNIVMFTFFSEATFGSVGAVIDREAIVRKIHFPRLVVPCAVVLTASFNLVLNVGVVVIFALASGVPVRWTWLLAIPLLLVLIFFVAGLAMLLSALFVRVRDLRPIWEVVLQVLFYGTPVLYTVETIINSKLPEWVKDLVLMNPLACIFEQFRHWVIDPSSPTAASALGAGWKLVVPFVIVTGLFALGFWVFNRESPRIAEML
jgi:ABC-2 type transport system permease protein